MKLQNIFMSAAMLAIFVLATLNTVIGLVQSAIEAIQAILAAILFVAKIACQVVKFIQQALYKFDWLLSALNSLIDIVHSSLEGWMVSTVQPEPTNQPIPLLVEATTFPSERTAFEGYAIASLEPIAQHVQPATTNSLELVVAPTTLMLTGAATIPSEKTAFEYYAQSAIAHSLELAVTESDSAIASLEAINSSDSLDSQIEVNTKSLGKVITIENETGLTPLSVPGVYIQRTSKKRKLTKSELSKLTVLQLRDRIAEVVKNNNSLVVPKKSVKKAVLVDWLMAN